MQGVRFANGRIEKDIEAIVYCTGYLFSYPQFETLHPQLVTNGERVRGLYQQLFNIRHPALAFPALSYKIVPFPITDVQGAAMARVWANRLTLPSEQDMTLAEEKQVEELGDGRKFHVLGYPKDAEYINGMHDWVMTARAGPGREPVCWEERELWMRENDLAMRKKFVKMGSRAKTMEELGFHYEKEGEKVRDVA